MYTCELISHVKTNNYHHQQKNPHQKESHKRTKSTRLHLGRLLQTTIQPQRQGMAKNVQRTHQIPHHQWSLSSTIHNHIRSMGSPPTIPLSTISKPDCQFVTDTGTDCQTQSTILPVDDTLGTIVARAHT